MLTMTTKRISVFVCVCVCVCVAWLATGELKVENNIINYKK